MSEPQLSAGYAEPTVMWRMVRADGLSSHAVIDPRRDGVAVMWFVNGRPMGIRYFADWTGALIWSERMQVQNWTTGWRLVPE